MSKLMLLPLIVVLPIQAALAQAKKGTAKNQTSANSNQKKKTVGELLRSLTSVTD